MNIGRPVRLIRVLGEDIFSWDPPEEAPLQQEEAPLQQEVVPLHEEEEAPLQQEVAC